MISRNLEKAVTAYKSRNAKLSREAHDRPRPEAEERHTQAQGQYIKSMIYGGLDGTITTFAVVAGVSGASLSAAVVLIMGFANLIADGLSMAIGDFLSTRSENEYNRAERERERWEVDHYPQGEKREMAELYEGRGMDRQDAEAMTEILSRNPEAWVSVMMAEELGIVESAQSPVKNALVTFASFAIFGFIPLLAYIGSRFLPALKPSTFLVSSVLTGLILFIMGALKTRLTRRSWLWSGTEMLLVGGLAAAAAYGIGLVLSRIVGA